MAKSNKGELEVDVDVQVEIEEDAPLGALKTFDEFRGRVLKLMQAKSLANIELGWTLNAAAEKLKDEYAQLLADLEHNGVSASTAQVMQWVARLFPPTKYNPALSWTHHKICAGTEGERFRWQKQAVAKGWSTRDLEAAIERAKREEHGSGNGAGEGSQEPTMPDPTRMARTDFVAAVLQTRFPVFERDAELAKHVALAVFAIGDEWQKAQEPARAEGAEMPDVSAAFAEPVPA